MIGKYSKEQIQEFFSLLKSGKICDSKEFRQLRVIFIKQAGKIFGNFQEQAFLEQILNMKDRISFISPFRIYVISAKVPALIKDLSTRDTIEFSYLSYKSFALAFELEGEKVELIENLLKSKRLPLDLWSKSGFQLWKWETQVFDVDGNVRELT